MGTKYGVSLVEKKKKIFFLMRGKEKNKVIKKKNKRTSLGMGDQKTTGD